MGNISFAAKINITMNTIIIVRDLFLSHVNEMIINA
jgi:hypothetical protein